MAGLDKITEFRFYVDRFRWENYERDFRKLRKLKRLYWHIVFLDYKDSTYPNLDSQLNAFNIRVYKSFLGSFFKPYEIVAKWEAKLDGFLKLYLKENLEEWNAWKGELEQHFGKHFIHLHEIMKNNIEYNVRKIDPPSTSILNLTEFDAYHSKIDQVISSLLSDHIKYTQYRSQKKTDTLSDFPITISDELIEEVHQLTYSYSTSRFTYWFLNNFESRLPPDGPFTLIKSENLHQAFNALLNQFPGYESLDKSTLVHMMDLFCRDEQGQSFKKPSIRAFLTREGY